MKKDNVLKIIDEVMNNREIDSIRNAILAIRDKVLEMPDDNDEWEKDYVADLKLRGDCPFNVTIPYFLDRKPEIHIYNFMCCRKMGSAICGRNGTLRMTIIRKGRKNENR